MNLAERISRILSTRLGERVCMPTYGSDLYKLRDRHLNDEARLLFALYCKEAIERWEDVKVVKAELTRINAVNGAFSFRLYLENYEVIEGMI